MGPKCCNGVQSIESVTVCSMFGENILSEVIGLDTYAV